MMRVHKLIFPFLGSYLGFFGENADSNSMTDMNENKERINAKMAMLTRVFFGVKLFLNKFL